MTYSFFKNLNKSLNHVADLEVLSPASHRTDQNSALKLNKQVIVH